MKGKLDQYEGNFLRGEDLPEGVVIPVTISGFVPPQAEKDARGKTIDKAILSFAGKDKRLILCKTSFRIVKLLHGSVGDEPYDGWTGKEVNIQRRYLHRLCAFGVHNELCVRIVPPVGTPVPGRLIRFLGRAKPYAEDAEKP